jgi:dTMP kinase
MMADISRGRFITLEGGEGTGKSTLQHALAERLAANGIEVVETREPGGTPLAESVRKLALHPPRSEAWSPMAEALLMNAARSDHLDKLIRPALTAGKWVICDRFADSTRVYQSVGGGVPMDFLKAMERSVLAQDVPDLTLVLDAPLDATAGRRKSRPGVSDAFEVRPDDFHQAVRTGFIELVRTDPARCRLLDASRPADEVADAAWTELDRLLAARGQGA